MSGPLKEVVRLATPQTVTIAGVTVTVVSYGPMAAGIRIGSSCLSFVYGRKEAREMSELFAQVANSLVDS